MSSNFVNTSQYTINGAFHLDVGIITKLAMVGNALMLDKGGNIRFFGLFNFTVRI